MIDWNKATFGWNFEVRLIHIYQVSASFTMLAQGLTLRTKDITRVIGKITRFSNISDAKRTAKFDAKQRSSIILQNIFSSRNNVAKQLKKTFHCRIFKLKKNFIKFVSRNKDIGFLHSETELAVFTPSLILLPFLRPPVFELWCNRPTLTGFSAVCCIFLAFRVRILAKD